MKKLIVFTGILFSFNSFAQTPIAAALLKPKTYRYAEVLITVTNFWGTQRKMAIDTGQHIPIERLPYITDSSGKDILVTTPIDALNYMDNKGWEFVSVNETRFGDYHIFFRRKIAK